MKVGRIWYPVVLGEPVYAACSFQLSIAAIVLLVSLVGLGIGHAHAGPSDHFVTTWKTDNPGTSNDTSIIVPMIGGPYDVDWDNDGTFDEFGLVGPTTHDFGVAGTYTIRIDGSYDSIRFNSADDRLKIVSLDQWGTRTWATMGRAFYGCSYLEIPATDMPDLSAVTDMSGMFSYANSANPDTSGWDTSAVTDMTSMFEGATSATPDTGDWDTSTVTGMAAMFADTNLANPDTGNWDTSSVTDMGWMFHDANSANPDTSGWDTSAVTRMKQMFYEADSANPDTSGWDTSSVTDMFGMFSGATSANPDTSGWETSTVTDMGSMFNGASLANPDTSGWDTSSVEYMDSMFQDATSASPDTSGWDTGNVIDMSAMFRGAVAANPDTSGWDTGNVTQMIVMFREAVSFDQNIGSWNVTSLTNASGMFDGVALSTENYEGLLIGWSAQDLQSGVTFSGGDSTYCSAPAASARANMISSNGWTISDGGHWCETIFSDGFEQPEQCIWIPDQEDPGCRGWDPGEPYPPRLCALVECQIPPPGAPGYEPGWESCKYICVDQP